jgi:hypothetical protein
MHQIKRLDLMIAYSCNLSCGGCISVSDRSRSGVAPVEDVQAWITQWKQILEPGVIAIFGGEPCLHPDLIEICQLVRHAWPSSTIRLITNGYLLDNFDSGSWFKFEPFEIQVSIHRSDHEHIINKNIAKIIKHHTKWKVIPSDQPKGHEKIRWQRPHFSIYKSWFKDFVVPYQGSPDDPKPWHSDPAQAHAICGAPNTPILYKGLLYKCPAVANVIDVSGENWFAYKACSGEDTLTEFISGIGHPESVCAQCPEQQQAQIIDHWNPINVIVKQKNIS